ncbi:hypothetical protein GCM10027187_01900 [Streptosporangium sandarakinum]|uniref:WD40 repeat protein n=1 Tax=Streptosporangium sandarakinum TaxID=1260955 RepID=A0A852UZ40_9ACTN|nr:serine/threonine-protein kinase [Streptosporangium sandarakinum]NYF40403.1 WD40 repeat protein [Streptosporangium sandarakinum]
MATALIDGDPRRIGDYWLAGRLGAGGQGVVYEAYAEDGRRVAIKVLHGDPADDPDLRDRFGREATAARRVASFCTAAVLAAELDGPRPYIVSEYIEGLSLRQAVTGGHRFAGGELHRLATAIATALTAIHDAGVIHRDLKPDNVLIGTDGPRVIDFGIARTLDMSLTATGMVTGTPTYMAPEVFTGRRAGAPADVFAWGGVVLFAATGEDPFHAESLGGVMHRVLSVDPDLSVLPPPLRPLLSAALSKDPLQRPTARALLLTLISGDGQLGTARLLAEGSREAARITAPADDPALGTLAEQAYALLSPAERETVPEVFLRLVTVDEHGDVVTRRADLAEFTEGRALHETAAVNRVLEVFGHLLIREGRQIRAASPALPHAWHRLRAWIEADRDGLAVHRRILDAARRWDAAGRRDGDLLHGAALEDALSWAAGPHGHITLTPAERGFLETGAALNRRRARRNKLISTCLGVLLAISLGAGVFAVRQGTLADARNERITQQRDQAQAARAATLAGRARDTDPRLATLLSVAAWRLDPSPRSRAALTASLVQRETGVFRDPASAADTERRLSRDGRTLVSVDGDAARLWDVRTGRQVGGVTRLGLAGEPILSVALGPTGRTLLVLTGRNARVWDLRTGEAGRTWRFPKELDPEAGYAIAADFGTVERYALVTVDQRLYVWDLRTGTRAVMRDPWNRAMSPTGTSMYAWSPDGRSLLRYDLPALRVQGDGIPVPESCRDCPAPVAVSPDGRQVALPYGRRLYLVDLTGRISSPLGGEHGRWNEGAVAFSADGRLAASAGDRTLQIWRVEDGRLMATLPVRGSREVSQGDIPLAGFDPDGRFFRYLVGDRVFSLDLTGLPTTVPKEQLSEGRLSPDGRLALTSKSGDDVVLRNTRDGRPVASPLAARDGEGSLSGMAFSPDGELAAIGRYRGGITVMDTATWKPLGEVRARKDGHDPEIMAFSPDGTRLAVGLSGELAGRPNEYRVQVWDWKAGRLLWSADLGEVSALTFSPDGARLAIASDEGRILDAATGKPLGDAFDGAGRGFRILQMFFARRGKALATVDSRGHLTLWDVATHRPVTPAARGKLTYAQAAAYSPREDVAAAITDSGRVQLFDLTAGASLGTLEATQEVLSTAFTADGSALLALDRDGAVHRWTVSADGLAKAACARAGRTLTQAEWRTNLPETPYRDVCAS